MIKKVFLCFLIVSMLTGCSNVSGKEALLNKIGKIEHSLNQDNLESVKAQAEELKDLYQKNKWKLQLLGDEGEYEGLYESINRLIAAIDGKDQKGAKVELATVKAYVEDIYSL